VGHTCDAAKEIEMRKLIVAIFLCLSFSGGIALAAELSAKDATILKKAGIPVYQDAEFVNGALGGEIGARFASSVPAADVQAFYRGKFPSWALNSEYGSWILYDGKPGGGPAAYMGKKQIYVKTNQNLPAWFGVDKSKTTEIIIVVPSD